MAGLLIVAAMAMAAPAEARHISFEDFHCPTNVQAEALADGTIRLTWTPDNEDAVPAENWSIARAVDGGEFDQTFANIDGNLTEFVDTDVEPGRTYSYEIVPEGHKLFSPSQGCTPVTATAVPFFPGVAGGLLAAAGLLVGYVALRRRA